MNPLRKTFAYFRKNTVRTNACRGTCVPMMIVVMMLMMIIIIMKIRCCYLFFVHKSEIKLRVWETFAKENLRVLRI